LNAESSHLAVPRLPYTARQRIIVVDDEIAFRERAVVADAAKGSSWDEIVAGGAFGVAAGMLFPMTSILVGTSVAARELYKRVSEARTRGLNLLTVARSETRGLEFPPGHPFDNTIYIGEPAGDSRIYWPAAEFHRRTFESKAAEAVRLLMALGATRILAISDEGWDRAFASSLDLSLPAQETQLKGRVATSGNQSLLFEARLAPSRPRIPRGLHWLPTEPTWRQVEIGRIHHRLRDFRLLITYKSDFGIDANFEKRVLKTKLKLGGDFQAHRSTVWRLEGEFSDRSPSLLTRARGRLR
jgi:hypothetical protein